MKNIIKIIFLALLFVATSRGAFGASEEEECFKQLNNQVRSDVRFSNHTGILPNRDLTKVLYNEQQNSYINLSNYNEFLNYAAKNPAYDYDGSRRSKGLDNTDFLLRRQHIATVIAQDSYIVTKIVGFGQDSNFTFPLPVRGEKPYGDPYNSDLKTFKEFLAYTHHSIKGDFLSCGIIRVIPLGGRTFSDISEANYFSNILDGEDSQQSLGGEKCHSGFEGTKITGDGKEFYSMKSNICVIDYSVNDFVKMELISIAYNNNSSYFNEYVVFPLQVEAMRNRDTERNGLVGIRDRFLDFLDKRTCLELVHGNNKDNLPSGCNRNFSSNLLSINFDKGVFGKALSFILPNVYASRNFNFSQEDTDKASGMVLYENMPYDIYKKLMSIENETFRDFLRMALAQNFEEYIKTRQKQGIIISPYEEVFLNCEIPYSEREEIVIDFLTNLEDTQNIDFIDLTYSNPRFGDCIIPYPDKKNLAKVVPDSFDSNKLLAEQLSGEYVGPEVSEEFINLAKMQNELILEHQKVIDKLTEDYNIGLITSDELNEKIAEERNKLDEAIQNLIAENDKVKEQIITQIDEGGKNLDTSGMIPSNNINNSKVVIICVAVVLILLGLITMFYVVKKGKTKQE